MWNIRLFEIPLGPNQKLTPAGYLQKNIGGDYHVAVEIIENHIHKYDLHGRDEEQDSWWCRRVSDKTNTVLVIEGASASPETGP